MPPLTMKFSMVSNRDSVSAKPITILSKDLVMLNDAYKFWKREGFGQEINFRNSEF